MEEENTYDTHINKSQLSQQQRTEFGRHPCYLFNNHDVHDAFYNGTKHQSKYDANVPAAVGNYGAHERQKHYRCAN